MQNCSFGAVLLFDTFFLKMNDFGFLLIKKWDLLWFMSNNSYFSRAIAMHYRVYFL